MHETARHAIHSFETLGVLVETVEAIQQQIMDISTLHRPRGGNCSRVSHQIRTYTKAHVRMLRGLFMRSQSNKERLQNEIALVRVDKLA